MLERVETPDNPVHQFILNRDEDNALTILKVEDIYFRLADGNTLIHLAAKLGFLNLTRKLLAFGANPNIKNNDNETPLSLAIRFDRHYVIDELFGKIDRSSPDIGYAILAAVVKKDVRLVLLLCENCKKDSLIKAFFTCLTNELKDTSLHLAVKLDHLPLVELLMENGADPFHKNGESLSAFQLSFNARKQTIAIAIFLKQSSTFSYERMVALFYKSIALKMTQFALCLLKKMQETIEKCNFEFFNPKGHNTSLHITAKYGNLSVFLFLLANNLDPYKFNKIENNALSIAVINYKRSADLNYKYIIDAILARSKPTPAIGVAIFHAVDYGDEELTRRLCVKSGDMIQNILNETVVQKKRALDVAANKNKPKIVALLMSYGANPYELNADKQSALSIAINISNKFKFMSGTQKCYDVIDLMLSSNFPVSEALGAAILQAAKNIDIPLVKRLCEKLDKKLIKSTLEATCFSFKKESVLHVAFNYHNPKMIELLLSYGDLNLHIPNEKNQTPMSYLFSCNRDFIDKVIANHPEKLCNDYLNDLGNCYLTAFPHSTLFHHNHVLATDLKTYDSSTSPCAKWLWLAKRYSKLPNNFGQLAKSIRKLFALAFSQEEIFTEKLTVKQVADNLQTLAGKHFQVETISLLEDDNNQSSVVNFSIFGLRHQDEEDIELDSLFKMPESVLNGPS